MKGNDEERQDVHTYSSFQLIKLGLYAVLFLLFLASLVTQKLSLAIASSKLITDFKQDKKTASNSSDHRHVIITLSNGMFTISATLFSLVCFVYNIKKMNFLLKLLRLVNRARFVYIESTNR